MAKGYGNEVTNDKFVSLFRKKKLLAGLIVLFLALVATVTVVTLYGLHTGGFTMSVSDELSNAGVKLYQYEEDALDKVEGKSKLKGPELASVQPMEQPQVLENYVVNNVVNVDGVDKHGGEYKSNAGDYIGYTFYVKNDGNKPCDMQSQLMISSVTRNMDKAVRIWVITSRSGDSSTTSEIYMLEDETPKDYLAIMTGFGYYRQPVNFESKTTVVTTPYLEVTPDEYIKITIIMWLEGEDPDCTDGNFGITESERQGGNIEGGSIKISMAFTSYKEKIV